MPQCWKKKTPNHLNIVNGFTMPHFGNHGRILLMRGEKEMNKEAAASPCVRENESIGPTPFYCNSSQQTAGAVNGA